MAHVDWMIRGLTISTCNCDHGCPCQFSALPTHGDCRAAVAMRIDEGHFADVSLDGATWAALFAWPRAIHEGDGEALIILDESTSEAQREGLLTILSGQETEPGATIFNVFAGTLTTMHETRFLPIQFEGDMETRRGHFSVPGIVEAKATPIINPASGEENRARVTLPEGFEYTEAEYASGTVSAHGDISLDWANAHAHFAIYHMTPQGVVR